MVYNPIYLFRNAHFNTIFRKAFTNHSLIYKRKRIRTKDEDFIDLDFSSVNSKKIIVLNHGLEGSSNSKYIQSNTIYFNKKGYDVCAVNMRGCSGVPNMLYSSYHSGKTDDMGLVIDYVSKRYDEIIIVGYSLGGNIVLKYSGEIGGAINSKIKKAIGISVPVDLKSSSIELTKAKNFIYNYVFMKEMKEKLKVKVEKFGLDISYKEIELINNFNKFDDIYTSVAHGFTDAEDYWKKNSSKQFIPSIKIPSLLINAKDDTFLGEGCYPIEEAESNPLFTLEIPRYGGHVGFNVSLNKNSNFWLEKRILNFIENE